MVEPINLEDAMEQVETLLDAGELDGAAEYLRALHPADCAELLRPLETETQALLVADFAPAELALVFEQMNEEDAAEVALLLMPDATAEVLDEMEPDMAADLLGQLAPEEAATILEQMDSADTVSPLLAYAGDTAGGIMNVPPPSLRRLMTVSEAFQFIKQSFHDANEIFYLYVLDREGRLIGVVNLRALILADPDQTIEEIMHREVTTVHEDVDQEEVAHILARYDLLALPVVDELGHLVGIVSVDDVVDVLEQEATEDIYHLAQVSPESAIFSPLTRSLRDRLPWLCVNVGTAFLASTVVAAYESTIAQVAMLAVFMPIIAGQGGNAGNQTMTIVVRSMALGEIELRSVWRALGREVILGLLNGVTLGVMVGLIAWFWKGNLFMGGLVAIAMLGNLIIAAMAGVLVPMTLKRLHLDPALASSIFVTTATDIAGFALLLGLASLSLQWLL